MVNCLGGLPHRTYIAYIWLHVLHNRYHLKNCSLFIPKLLMEVSVCVVFGFGEYMIIINKMSQSTLVLHGLFCISIF